MAKNIDVSALKEFQKKLGALPGALENAERAACAELAERLLTSAVKRTIERTGHLKGSYRSSAVSPTGRGCTATVYNPVKYAPYVEYGHRTRGGRGWVQGKYMLTKATDEIDKKAGRIVEKLVMEELEKTWR